MQPTDAEFPPLACRPEAFHYVRHQLPHLASTHGLVHCILGVSLHALDDGQRPEAIDAELNRLAAKVRKQGRSNHPTAVITHLHEVLFEQEGFGGPPEDKKFNPLNSYLPAVFGMKHGLPITLGIVYKAVAERVGLEVEGIFSLAHFLVRVHDGQGWLIVDPFDRGRILTVDEACQMIARKLERPMDSHLGHLPTASNKQWLMRVIVNLVQVFEAMQSDHDLHAMHELLMLVEQHG